MTFLQRLRSLRFSPSPDAQLFMGVIGIILIALLVGACSTGQQQTTIASLELALATAETGANAYRRLPVCDGTTSLCKNLAIVGNLQALDDKAYITVKTAQAKAATGSSVEVTAAVAAITAFQSLVDSLPRLLK